MYIYIYIYIKVNGTAAQPLSVQAAQPFIYVHMHALFRSTNFVCVFLGRDSSSPLAANPGSQPSGHEQWVEPHQAAQQAAQPHQATQQQEIKAAQPQEAAQPQQAAMPFTHWFPFPMDCYPVAPDQPWWIYEHIPSTSWTAAASATAAVAPAVNSAAPSAAASTADTAAAHKQKSRRKEQPKLFPELFILHVWQVHSQYIHI